MRHCSNKHGQKESTGARLRCSPSSPMDPSSRRRRTQHEQVHRLAEALHDLDLAGEAEPGVPRSKSDNPGQCASRCCSKALWGKQLCSVRSASHRLDSSVRQSRRSRRKCLDFQGFWPLVRLPPGFQTSHNLPCFRIASIPFSDILGQARTASTAPAEFVVRFDRGPITEKVEKQAARRFLLGQFVTSLEDLPCLCQQ
jgi:hypothetical protein